MNYEQKYLALLEAIQTESMERNTRNAVTKSIFGAQLTIDELMHNKFPILQGRKIFYKGVVGELAAFLRGPKHIEDFTSQGCNYWNEWAEKDGSINVDYGNAWLDYNGVNQLQSVVDSLRNDPYGRRHIINAWRPDKLSELSLPCCHYSYQWYVDNSNHLHMVWIQRSVDTILGLPSDVILAAVLNLLMARTTGYLPGRLTMQLGDTHIYSSHFAELDAYMSSAVAMAHSPKPSYWLSPVATVFNFTPEMFDLTGYEHGPKLTFKLEK